MKKFVLIFCFILFTAKADVHVGDHVMASCGSQLDPIAVEVTAIIDHSYEDWNINTSDYEQKTQTFIKGKALAPSTKFNVFCRNHVETFDEGLFYETESMTLLSGPIEEINSFEGYGIGDKIIVEDKFNGKVAEYNGQIHTIYSNGYAEIRNLELRGWSADYVDINEYNRNYINLVKVRLHLKSYENQSYIDTFKIGKKVKYYFPNNNREHEPIEYLEGEITNVEYDYKRDKVSVTFNNTLNKPKGVETHYWPYSKRVVLTGNRSQTLELIDNDTIRSNQEEEMIRRQTKRIIKIQQIPVQQQINPNASALEKLFGLLDFY